MHQVFRTLTFGLSGIAAFLLAATTSAHAAEQNLPSSPTIEYDYWDRFLRAAVIEVGVVPRSSRVMLGPTTGTRVVTHNPNKSRFEGNRLTYYYLTEEALEDLETEKAALGELVNDPLFDQLSSDERLAYWLNMRALAVVSYVARNFPIGRFASHSSAIREEPVLSIDGRVLSVADTEDLILDRWSDPLVIYGLHNGSIGSPDIPAQAYTGDDVWAMLDRNAATFIGGFRGLRVHGKRVGVAKFYQPYVEMFGDEPEFMAHLYEYAPEPLREDLSSASKFSFAFDDTWLANLVREERQLSFPMPIHNNIDFFTARNPQFARWFAINQRYGASVLQHLLQLGIWNKSGHVTLPSMRRATVTIEEEVND